MSRTRRFARWVAWNIDGSSLYPAEIPRIEFFLHDGIGPENQVGNELYLNNSFDRGHIARRADLLWGTLEEATQANDDSFCYANITPQMDNFNQSKKAGVWGLLELAILDDRKRLGGSAVDGRLLSVLSGPVLADEDPEYRDGVRVPRQFWKIILYSVGGSLRARAFVLKQDPDVRSAADFDFSGFSTYERSVDFVSGLVDLSFGLDEWSENEQSRAFMNEERALTSVDDIVW